MLAACVFRSFPGPTTPVALQSDRGRCSSRKTQARAIFTPRTSFEAPALPSSPSPQRLDPAQLLGVRMAIVRSPALYTLRLMLIPFGHLRTSQCSWTGLYTRQCYIRGSWFLMKCWQTSTDQNMICPADLNFKQFQYARRCRDSGHSSVLQSLATPLHLPSHRTVSA